VVQHEVPSVSELYRLTLARLLKMDASDAEFDSQIIEAGKLCAATYWRDGARSMAYAGASPQHRTILKKLRSMSVLYSTEPGDNPREVRFFHDSMQSYLTAVALTSDAQGLDFLARAAGAVPFREGGAEAELFRMCVGLIPAAAVAAYIDSTISQWRARFAEDVAVSAVARAIQVALKLPSAAEHPTVDQLMSTALTAVQQPGAPDLARVELFEALAPLFWPLLNRCYVDVSTVPPGGDVVIDGAAVGPAPLSYACVVGAQIVITATVVESGRPLRGSCAVTVQPDQSPVVLVLRR
jgi:hypothetical protein